VAGELLHLLRMNASRQRLVHQGHGLGVGVGHGLHRRPAVGVLTVFELFDLRGIAARAGFRGGDANLVEISSLSCARRHGRYRRRRRSQHAC
jgi:hypothetical protein